jgi:type II secretory pathway component PulJ
MRRAVTLIELMVALLAAALIAAALWYVWSASQADAEDADRRLGAVRACQLVSQSLAIDLSRMLAPSPEREPVITPRRLLFYAAATTGLREKLAKLELIPLQMVDYALDPASHHVVVKNGDPTGSLAHVELADLRFRLTRPLNLFEQPSDTQETPAYLAVQAVWRPSEDMRAKRASKPRDVVSMAFAFGLPALTYRVRYPGWNANPTSKYQGP